MKLTIVRYRYVLLTFVAALIRLPYLNTFPPAGIITILPRLLSAFAGIISVLLLVRIIELQSKNRLLALCSGLAFATMPWHIEESRVFSPIMLGLTVLLTTAVVILKIRNRVIQIILLFTGMIIFYLAHPSFWLFANRHGIPDLYHFGYNIFKLTSGEFLFYKNDTFWLGGLRSGILLPFVLPVFLFGLIEIFKKIGQKQVIHLFIFGLILFLSLLNPKFPEEREYFLVTPYIALMLGYGTIKLIEQFKSPNTLLKLIITAYILFVTYDYMIFFHYYTVHYNNRIKIEVPYEKRTF